MVLFSDINDSFAAAVMGTRPVEEEYPYRHKYEELGQRLDIDRNCYTRGSMKIGDQEFPALLFLVHASSPHAKKEQFTRNGTDSYLATAVYASHDALWKAIQKQALNLDTLALIKQGAFSNVPGNRDMKDVFAEMVKVPLNRPEAPKKYIICEGTGLAKRAGLKPTGRRLEGWGWKEAKLWLPKSASSYTKVS